MTKIAILEDDERIANFITAGLNSESYQVKHFSRISEFIDVLENQTFDVLVLDRMIQRSDSINWVKTIKMLSPNIRIIILSALSGSIQRIEGLEMGADDYIEKPFKYQELSLRIKKVVNKDVGSREAVIRYSDIVINLDNQQMQRNGIPINLSPYEFKLMVIFVKKPNKVHSRTELLDYVWGNSYDSETNIVDVAIGKLRKKINTSTSSQLIKSCRGRGYSLADKTV